MRSSPENSEYNYVRTFPIPNKLSHFWHVISQSRHQTRGSFSPARFILYKRQNNGLKIHRVLFWVFEWYLMKISSFLINRSQLLQTRRIKLFILLTVASNFFYTWHMRRDVQQGPITANQASKLERYVDTFAYLNLTTKVSFWKCSRYNRFFIRVFEWKSA